MKDKMTRYVIAQKSRKQRNPVALWQVVQCGMVLFENANKGLCVWWCDTNGFKRGLIKPKL